ncbi:MAG: site-specific integrase [Nitrospinae bacterium]|nr:site-specific integrase [Nitrospinota bacterium]
MLTGKVPMLPAIRSKKELSITLSRELPKYFTKPEMDSVLESVRDNSKKHLLINMLWQTGVRISELLKVKVKDIDFYAKTIKVASLKRRKKLQRVIPIQAGLIGEIGVYTAINKLQNEGRLFNFSRHRAYHIIRKTVLKAGLDPERAHPHTFRHSFGVHAVLNGVPIIVIKNWMGHSNINSTLIYMQVLGSDTRQFYENLKF